MNVNFLEGPLVVVVILDIHGPSLEPLVVRCRFDVEPRRVPVLFVSAEVPFNHHTFDAG